MRFLLLFAFEFFLLSSAQTKISSSYSYKSRIMILQEMVSNCEENVDRINNASAIQNETIAELHVELNRTNEELSLARYQLSQTRNQFNQTNEHFKLTNDQLNQMKIEFFQANLKLNLTQIQLEHTKIEHDQTKRELDQTKIELDQIKNELNQTKSERDQTKSEHDQTQRELDQTKIELDKIKNELNQTKSELDQRNNERDQTKREHDQTKRELDQTKIELDQIKNKLNQTKSELDQRNNERDQTKREHDQTKIEQVQIKNKLNQTKNELDQRKNERDQTKRELDATKEDVCQLKRAKGSCQDYKIKWYYNQDAQQCLQFYFSGCEGNGNQFETEEECRGKCVEQPQLQIDVCKLPNEFGNCSDFEERWYFHNSLGQCSRFIYSGCSGNHNNFNSESDCQKRCGPATKLEKVTPTGIAELSGDFLTEYCHLDVDAGPCQGNLPRYYYDKSDGVCKHYYYGGCQGNGNRFVLKQDCENKCSNSQDVCTLPVVHGPCSGSFRQWYFNKAASICEEFRYGGCEGNGNRFDSVKDCENRCAAQPNVPVNITTITAISQLPNQPGNCLRNRTRFYFDKVLRKCFTIKNRGCDGHDNRFDSKESCERSGGQFKGQEDVSVFTHGNKTSFASNGEVKINCHTKNKQQTFWYKNESLIQFDDRVSLLANGTLFIRKATPMDSGIYTCAVSSKYSHANASIAISIREAAIPDECVDTPFFANCALIAKAKYCNNQYYAKFCCRSCALNNQITS